MVLISKYVSSINKIIERAGIIGSESEFHVYVRYSLIVVQ